MASGTPSSNKKKLHGWEFFRSIGSPKHVVAPMVNQSELPFRMLCRKYGATLAYTPMYHSRIFSENPSYRKDFTTCPEDRPLVVQFCANDPKVLLEAARHVEDRCDAVDINFGCPQGIARRGHYGAFLMEDQDLVCNLVNILHENLKVPVFAKIRIYGNSEEDIEKSIEYARKIEKAGASLIAVHGRTRDMKGPKTGIADYNVIRRIREAVGVPVYSNGNVLEYEDVPKLMQAAGVQGVLSADSLLWNPALFSGKDVDKCQLALEYLDMTERYPGAALSAVRAHMFSMLADELRLLPDHRSAMGASISNSDYRRVISEVIRELEIARNRLGPDIIPRRVSWYSEASVKSSKEAEDPSNTVNALMKGCTTYHLRGETHSANGTVLRPVVETVDYYAKLGEKDRGIVDMVNKGIRDESDRAYEYLVAREKIKELNLPKVDYSEIFEKAKQPRKKRKAQFKDGKAAADVDDKTEKTAENQE